MPVGVVDTLGGDIPVPVGGGMAVGVPPTDVDVLLERTPFWLAIGEDSPYQRQTAPFQREQIDQAPEAGEQSLAGWWVRSQMSFHYGAGLDWLDTTARPAPEDRLRFAASRNVDVWTPGQVTRLNGTELFRSAEPGARCWVEVVDGGGLIFTSTAHSFVEVFDGTSWTTRDLGGTDPVRAFCTDGVNFYAATISAVYSAPIAGAEAPTKVYDLPGTEVPMQLAWVKQRLILGHGPKVFVLENPGPALPDPLHTHPTPSWRWSAFADSPSGVIGAGYAGSLSALYRFELTALLDAPVLGPGVVLVSLPAGERVHAVSNYLSALLVLGTDRGVRVCDFDGFTNALTLGPLSVVTEAPVSALGGWDRFVFAGTRVGGESMLVRLDLGATLPDSTLFAWAPDLVFPDGDWTEAVTGVAFRADGRKVCAVAGRGLVEELTHTDAAQPAWLETARIRMGTVEDKSWVHLQVRGTFSDIALIGVSAHAPGGEVDEFVSIAVLGDGGGRIGLPARPGEWLALRFDLAEGAMLGSYQVQALPAGRRQRLVSIPVWVSDRQRTRSGMAVGYPGWGLDRLAEVEHLEVSAGPVTVLAPALFTGTLVGVIERLTFTQQHDMGEGTPGTGGVLQILLRTTR